MTSLLSEFKNLGPWKKGENYLVFVRQYGTLIQWCYKGGKLLQIWTYI